MPRTAIPGRRLKLTRVAYDSEAYGRVLQLRKEVFVAEQGVPLLEEIDPYETSSVHYLFFLDGQPVGTGRWRLTPSGVKIERMAISAAHRNAGLGAQMLQLMLRDMKADTRCAEQQIYLHAQEAAVSFYLRAGFVAEGARFYECDIAHVRMHKPALGV